MKVNIEGINISSIKEDTLLLLDDNKIKMARKPGRYRRKIPQGAPVNVKDGKEI